MLNPSFNAYILIPVYSEGQSLQIHYRFLNPPYLSDSMDYATDRSGGFGARRELLFENHNGQLLATHDSLVVISPVSLAIHLGFDFRNEHVSQKISMDGCLQ